jgi:hypothetical protein
MLANRGILLMERLRAVRIKQLSGLITGEIHS